MKIIAINIILLSSLIFTINAQEIEIPDSYDYSSKEEYQKSVIKIIEVIEWSDKHKLDENIDIRKEANQFINDWIENSNPSEIKINISSNISNILKNDKNPFADDFYMAYVRGYIYFSLKNKTITDEKPKNKAGIENLLKIYNNNLHLNIQSKTIKNLLEISDKGELDNWISDNQ